MICPNCGVELEEGSTECFLCGYKFETEEITDDIDEQTELNGDEGSDVIEDNTSEGSNNNPNKKNTAVVLIIMGIIIIAVVVAFILSKNNNKNSDSNPSKTTEVSTKEKTESPTEKETEASTEETTEVPTEKETEAPTDEKTEAPTEKETEIPTEEKTETPTDEKTEAPTEEDAPHQSTGLEVALPGEWTNYHAYSDDDAYAYSMKYVMDFSGDGSVTCVGYRSKNSGTYKVNNQDNTIEIDFNDCKFWDTGEYHDVKGYKVVMKFDFNTLTYTVLTGEPSGYENWKATDIWSMNY